jgi:plastocyanin
MYADVVKPDSHRYTWREPSPTVKQEFRKLSANVSRDVCVVALGAAGAPAHEPQVVKVTGGRMTPSTIVVSPGSRLSFKNADPFPHQLFEAGNPAWAPNPTAPGSTREWAAAAAGVHQIRDQLFPGMVMYIVVDERAVDFAFPDREGGFTLNVPPGEYTIRGYFDGKPAGRGLEGVRVGERGHELKEPLSLGGESK